MSASENITVSIRIRHRRGEELAYMYEKEELQKLGLTPSQLADVPEYYLNIGEVLTLAGRKLRIINIFSKFFAGWKHPGLNTASNTYGKALPFNFEITYLVEEV